MTSMRYKQVTVGLAFVFGFLLAVDPSIAIPVHSRFANAWTSQAFRDSSALVAPGFVNARLKQWDRNLGPDRKIPARIDTQIHRAAQDTLRDTIRKSRKTRLHRHIMADVRKATPGTVQRNSDVRSVASPPSDVSGDRHNKPPSGNAATARTSYHARTSRLLRNDVRQVSAAAPLSTTDPGGMGAQLVEPHVNRTDRPSHRRRHRHLPEESPSSEAANNNVSVIDQTSNHPADRPGTPPALDTPSGANIPTRPPARRLLR